MAFRLLILILRVSCIVKVDKIDPVSAFSSELESSKFENFPTFCGNHGATSGSNFHVIVNDRSNNLQASKDLTYLSKNGSYSV